MPRGDGTGPMGTGTMTGKGMGYCGGNDNPGSTDRCSRRFRRRGCGSGNGRRFGFNTDANPETADTGQQLTALKNRAQYLNNALDETTKLIDELESNQSQ